MKSTRALFSERRDAALEILRAYDRYTESEYQIATIIRSHRSSKEKEEAIIKIVRQNVRDIIYLERVDIIEGVKIVTDKDGKKIIAYQK